MVALAQLLGLKVKSENFAIRRGLFFLRRTRSLDRAIGGLRLGCTICGLVINIYDFDNLGGGVPHEANTLVLLQLSGIGWVCVLEATQRCLERLGGNTLTFGLEGVGQNILIFAFFGIQAVFKLLQVKVSTVQVVDQRLVF